MLFRSQVTGIVPGVTTPMDLLEEYLLEESKNPNHCHHPRDSPITENNNNNNKNINDNDNDDDETTNNKIETAKQVFQHSLDADLTSSSELSVMDLSSGWGGTGRITLIGDAAHAVRPYSGLGGSVAFEDAVVLSRLLANINNDDNDSNHDVVADALRQFETQRLPRVRSISDDQTMRSESFYRNGASSIPPWSDAYRDWIFAGPDAPSEPPHEEASSTSSSLARQI